MHLHHGGCINFVDDLYKGICAHVQKAVGRVNRYGYDGQLIDAVCNVPKRFQAY